MNKSIYIAGLAFLLAACAQTQTEGTESEETTNEEQMAQNETLAVADELNRQPDTKPMEYVVMETNKGTITLELDPNSAPVTVENFLAYVDEGFYDGTVFHRVIDGFMIQGGGFTNDGQRKETRAPIVLESQNGLKNEVGTIAMARTNAPNSATSQFFINVKDNEFLNYRPDNPGYAVFGRVTSGMEAVNEIRQVKTGVKNGMRDWPVEPVIIEKVYREGK
jgi:cyclophilin family peptidyl-prolyl cis-trans isomerase